MTCDHPSHEHTLRPSRLYLEALSVGALLVPMWWAVGKATAAMQFVGDAKPYFDVAIAGFLFYLAAEESGLNEWYLTHSFAAEKVLHPKQKDDIHSCVGRLWVSRGLGLYGEPAPYHPRWRRG